MNTLVQIGSTPAHARAAQDAGVSIVRLPHAAADSLGLNLLLHEVERRHGPLDVLGCRGYECSRRTGTG